MMIGGQKYKINQNVKDYSSLWKITDWFGLMEKVLEAAETTQADPRFQRRAGRSIRARHNAKNGGAKPTKHKSRGTSFKLRAVSAIRRVSANSDDKQQRRLLATGEMLLVDFINRVFRMILRR